MFLKINLSLNLIPDINKSLIKHNKIKLDNSCISISTRIFTHLAQGNHQKTHLNYFHQKVHFQLIYPFQRL